MAFAVCLTCDQKFRVKKYREKPTKFCSLDCYHKDMIGKPSNNEGKTQVAWNKGRRCPQFGGENHWNWKGGKSSKDYLERRRFYKTLQREILQRDNYTCQVCDQHSGYLQVDHIKSWAKYPKLRFDLDNCRTLCTACHYYVTFKRKLPQGVIWGHNFSKRIES